MNAIYGIFPCGKAVNVVYCTRNLPEGACCLLQKALTEIQDMMYFFVWKSVRNKWCSKIWLLHFLVTSIFLYACESWTLTTEIQRRMQAMEMKCYHKILPISCKDHVPNKEVCAKIQQAIGPHEDLTILKRGKLQWHVHVSRSSGLAKPSCKAQWKGEEDKADRRRGGKTTSGNGQAWSSPNSRGQWRTGKNGRNWLQNHLWCPNDPRG